MNGTLYGIALFETIRQLRSTMDGAITTGITPEPDGRTAPATPSAPTEASRSQGNLLLRVWRLAARPVARPKAANCPTC